MDSYYDGPLSRYAQSQGYVRGPKPETAPYESGAATVLANDPAYTEREEGDGE